MTLLDVLKLISKDLFPVQVDDDGYINTIPESSFEVTICFQCEEETWLTCNIQNEILIPWYDCEVSAITPNSNNSNSICVWLKHEEYIKKNYIQHIFKKKLEEPKGFNPFV